ncbi:MAG: tyrosine-protein phosphatase [Vicinamibacterales bacterium]
MTRRRAILTIAAALVLTALAYSQYWVLTGRTGTVVQGRLYRAAAMPADALVAFCRRHGISTVVDLRKESGDTRAEAEALARAGIRHVSLGTGQVPAPDTVEKFLGLMDATPGEPVLLHCTHGVGRTGVFAAIYRMEYQGWPAWRAIAEAVVFSGFGSFGPGNSKSEFLRDYTPRNQKRAR